MKRFPMILFLLCMLIVSAFPAFAEVPDDDDDDAVASAPVAAKKDPAKGFEAWSGKLTIWMTESLAKLNDGKLNAKQKDKLVADIAKKLESIKKRMGKMETQLQNIQKQQPIVKDLQGKLTDLQGKANAYKPVEKAAPAKDDKKEAPAALATPAAPAAPEKK